MSDQNLLTMKEQALEIFERDNLTGLINGDVNEVVDSLIAAHPEAQKHRPGENYSFNQFCEDFSISVTTNLVTAVLANTGRQASFMNRGF